MGLDVYAKVVVGVPTNKCIKVETRNSSIRKYNEDTGEPYDRPVSKKVLILFGKEFEIDDNFYFEKCLSEVHVDLQRFGFESGESSSRLSDLDLDRVVGLEVVEMGGRCENQSRRHISQLTIDAHKAKFKEITGMDGELYLTMYYSY